MTAHGDTPPAVDDEEWLSADQIAALAGGQVKANTVRSWWRKEMLDFRVFPELGTKSNKRSQRGAVQQFLDRKFGHKREPQANAAVVSQPVGTDARRDPRVVDLQDTLASVRASADAAIQALIVEAEQSAAVTAAHAEVSLAQARLDQARAEADMHRIEGLRHLQTVIRGYDLALSAYLQPDSPHTLLS